MPVTDDHRMPVLLRALIGVAAALPVVGGLVLLSLWSGSDEPRRFEPVVIERRSGDVAGPGERATDRSGRKEARPPAGAAAEPDDDGGTPDDTGDDVTVVGPDPTRVDDDDDAGDDGGDDDRDRGERDDTDD